MILIFYVKFFDENSLSKQNSLRWDAALCYCTVNYFVILAYQEILKIPTGAVHIQIQEAFESLNYLGMKFFSATHVQCTQFVSYIQCRL